MKLTSALFEAFLKCSTKCYLLSTGQAGVGNAYADWVRQQNDAYRKEAVQRLVTVAEGEAAVTSPCAANLKTATWRLAVDLSLETETIASRLHAVERVPSQGRGRPAQFIPVRFVFFNKLTKDDRLLMALDALLLSEVLGREVRVGNIIHGDDHAALKVKVTSLLEAVRKQTAKMSAMLAAGSPPDLILNRHCGECEFRDGCRQKAMEIDDLSLLSGMSVKERQKLRSKGIFTVTQLSYTFRPRRRPKRLRDKREKHHHSLKALAIREKKIHIAGSPELKIEGTPVYLDVEGLPDSGFYYLIGVSIGNGESAVHHSLWADAIEDEGKIWREFLAILAVVENPVLVHFGSYETTFLKSMSGRYGGPQEESPTARVIHLANNLVAFMFARFYFPSFSNGLKEIAGLLGFSWTDAGASGLSTVLWRHDWERTKDSTLRERIIRYNYEDCIALELVTKAVLEAVEQPASAGTNQSQEKVICVDSLKSQDTVWTKFKSPFPELEEVNRAARWDYQRDRIYVRSSRTIKRAAHRKHLRIQGLVPINKTIVCPDQPVCPHCGCVGIKPLVARTRVLHDLLFGRAALKRWVVEYRFYWHWCRQCRRRFGEPKNCWRETKFGRNLVAYVLYQLIELHIHQMVVQKELKRLWGYELNLCVIADFKAHGAEYYAETVRLILDRIRRGGLVHVDETRANVKGRTAYVWVFTNLHEVAYLYSDSREGDLLQSVLAGFSGVLVSDFYSAYDAIPCAQQKCLLHLVRDLNTDVLNHPFDEELAGIIRRFGQLLRSIVATIDRFGLKTRFLRKHLTRVSRFFRHLEKSSWNSEAALKCSERLEKNRGKLFTFLEHDGVPWNNNNAEHAIKAFAALRDVMRGSSTQKGVEDYLVLLSVCQTCVYSGVDFLDFLRSGEKDVDVFAGRQQKRRGRTRQMLRDADGIVRSHLWKRG